MSGDERDPQRLAAILDAHTGAQLVAGLDQFRNPTGATEFVCMREHAPAYEAFIVIEPLDGMLGGVELLSTLFAHHREHHADQPFG